MSKTAITWMEPSPGLTMKTIPAPQRMRTSEPATPTTNTSGSARAPNPLWLRSAEPKNLDGQSDRCRPEQQRPHDELGIRRCRQQDERDASRQRLPELGLRYHEPGLACV